MVAHEKYQLSALIGVVLGWVLSQFTDILKTKRRVRSLRKALLTEIGDLYRWIERLILIQRKGMMFCYKGFAPESMPFQLPIHVYSQYYAEISPKLTYSERISFGSIYGLISLMNSQHNRLESIIHESIKDKSKIIEAIAIFEAGYYNSLTAMHQIKFHVEHGKNIDISKIEDNDCAYIDKKATESINKLRIDSQNSTIEQIRNIKG